ncbi:MAG: NAD-binding protein [Acidimicrobiaceae bacterium]|nr:NAD-binding protein [Acidimicrobiaceae bacterium]
MEGDAPSISRPAVTRLVALRLRGPIITALAAVAIASTGYVMIQHWSWFDAAYMSIITLGQVGYGEVAPLGTGGRLWTMGVIGAGFTIYVYSAATLTALFLSGEVRAALREKRRTKVREHLHDHVVVAGFGRVGRAAADAAIRSGQQCEVIDTDESVEHAVEAAGAVFLLGDARDATVMRAAGVDRAAALITSLDDPSNAVVALTARAIAPSLRIVARVTDVSWRNRLMRAGASYVVPVYESVGASLAATALDAEVLRVLPIAGTDMRVVEMEVGANSLAEGQGLRALMQRCDDVHILGLRRDSGLERWHEAGDELRAGDVLAVMGSAATLGRLTSLVRRDSRE